MAYMAVACMAVAYMAVAHMVTAYETYLSVFKKNGIQAPRALGCGYIVIPCKVRTNFVTA